MLQQELENNAIMVYTSSAPADDILIMMLKTSWPALMRLGPHIPSTYADLCRNLLFANITSTAICSVITVVVLTTC